MMLRKNGSRRIVSCLHRMTSILCQSGNNQVTSGFLSFDVLLHRYMPVVPMVLVNGAEGIGTGWSTFIPNFNPRDIVANLRRLLLGEDPVPMQPWYKNFKGTIQEVPTKTAGKSYACNGVITKVFPLQPPPSQAGPESLHSKLLRLSN